MKNYLANLGGTLSVRTLELYQDSWGRYTSFCEGRALEPLSAPALLAWRVELVSLNYSPNTINSHLSAAKSILASLVPTGGISLEVYAQVRAVAQVSTRALRDRLKPEHEPLTDSSMQALIDSITGDTLADLRDKALLALLSTSGCRISELINLRVSDLNITRASFFVRGKTDSKRREAASSRVAMGYVLNWLYARGIESEWVFTSFAGRSMTMQDKPMTRQAAHNLIEKRSQSITKLSAHDFRRYVATRLAQRNITQAQQALGHRHIATTQRYVKRVALPSVDWLK